MENFVTTGFMKEHDFKFVSFDKEECIIEAELKENALNPYNIAHGGFIHGLMDTCCGVHIHLAAGKEGVTISSTVNYIKPGIGTKLIAKSKLIKMGKKIVFVSVECYNDKDELIANGLFNFNLIR